jgi:hypothetical protein
MPDVIRTTYKVGGDLGRSAGREPAGRAPRAILAGLAGTLLLLGIPLSGASAGDKYAAEFLRLGVGARALGMGGGFVAIADDASALYWNPAGLARLESAEMLFMHAEQFGSVANHDFIGFAQPLSTSGRAASVGIGLIRFSVDDILVTRDAFQDLNQNGRRDEGEPILPDLFYMDSDTEYGLLLSYAREVSDDLALGGDAKLIRQGLLDNTSFGLGLDLGALYRPVPALTLGLRVADATTTRISWDTGRKETVLPSWTLGVGYRRDLPRLHGRLNAGLAMASTLDGRETASQVSGGPWGGDVQGGVEYWHHGTVAARLGLDAGALTAGAGIRYRSLGADYAYLSHEELDATHRVSASVRF